MRLTTLILLLSVLSACAQTAPSPSASPEPGRPVRVERGGVVMTLALDREQLASGVRSWAAVEIENRSPKTVLWQGGGCNFPAAIVLTTATQVVPDPGRRWEGLAGRFKDLAASVGGPTDEARFVDEQHVGRGDPVCTADLRINELGAGERLQMRAAWEGDVAGTAAPPGPATVKASFPDLGPKGELGDPFRGDVRPLEATVETEIIDGGGRLIGPAEAVDRALADTRFAEWVAASEVARWQGVSVDLADDVWEVGLTVLVGDVPTSGVALVDRRSGTIRDFQRQPLGDG